LRFFSNLNVEIRGVLPVSEIHHEGLHISAQMGALLPNRSRGNQLAELDLNSESKRRQQPTGQEIIGVIKTQKRAEGYKTGRGRTPTRINEIKAFLRLRCIRNRLANIKASPGYHQLMQLWKQVIQKFKK
jgi:hypothetical protein